MTTMTTAAPPGLLAGYTFPTTAQSHRRTDYQHRQPNSAIPYVSTPATPTSASTSPTSPLGSSRPQTSASTAATSAVSSPRTQPSTLSSPRYGHAHAHSTTALAQLSQQQQQQQQPLQGPANLMTRQIRPPKAPLYVPAVLRPTERPRQPCNGACGRPHRGSTGSTARPYANPLTPPSSAENSFDGKEGVRHRAGCTAVTGDTMEDSTRTAAALAHYLPGDQLEGMSIRRVVTDEWREDEDVEQVTGTPTKDHWKPDSSSPICSYPQCGLVFGLMRRRHHCRRCGNIFCQMHSYYSVPLDQHARFHPQGFRERACSSCWQDFGAWQKSRKLRGSRESSEGSGSGTLTPVGSQDDKTGTQESPINTNNRRPGIKDVLVGSLPRDWTWSTF